MRQWLPIAQLANEVQTQKLSAVALIEKSLSLIADKNPEYHAILHTTEERARTRAAEIDARVANGENAGSLAGVPFIAKDNLLVFGAETTAASHMLQGFVAPYQATAIERLEAEGAICVAKANLDAFAHGGSTENSDYVVTKNPRDPSRVPGGSSGGSAAAVALELVPFALGTDTGGSIRQPASFCGVVGYKPTYGLVSRSGVVAMASSTDVIGPITQSIDDAALVLNVMSGKDALDATTVEKNAKGYQNISSTISGKKIGVIKEYFVNAVATGVQKEVLQAIDELKKLGAEVEEISLPSLHYALAVYYVIVPAELSSNLSRHDGQRFPFSATNTSSLDESYIKSRSEGFGAEATRRIMIGTHVLSSGYYDAYYNKAQIVRTKLLQEFSEAFSKYDFLVGPVAPTTAVKIGELDHDPLRMYLLDIMTVAANLTGIPAISVPCGESEGLPVGLQIMAAQHHDRELLAAAKAYEEIHR